MEQRINNLEDKLNLLMYQNIQRSTLTEGDVHTLFMGEKDALGHEHVTNSMNKLIDSQSGELSLNFDINMNTHLTTEIANDQNGRHRDVSAKLRSYISFEILGKPTDVFVAGGPSINYGKIRYLMTKAFNDDPLGELELCYPRYAKAQVPQFGVFVPIEGAFTITEFTSDLIATSNMLEEVEIVGISPVYYENVNKNVMAGLFISMSYSKARTSIGISAFPEVTEGLAARIQGNSRFPTFYNQVPKSDLVFNDIVHISGTINYIAVTILGYNTMERMFSNAVLTDSDYLDIKDKMDAMIDNLNKLVDAVNRVTKEIYSALNSLQDSINDINNVKFSSGFSFHSIASGISNIMELVASSVSDVVISEALFGMASLVKMGVKLIDFLNNSMDRTHGQEGRVVELTVRLIEFFSKTRYVTMSEERVQQEFVNIKNIMSVSDYKYVKVVQYVVDLSVVSESFLAKYVERVFGMVAEKVAQMNIYPKHSFVTISEVGPETYAVNSRKMLVEVSNQVGSLSQVSFNNVAKVKYFEWIGEEIPEEIQTGLMSRNPIEIQRCVSIFSYESMSYFVKGLAQSFGDYNLLFNNCHGACKDIIEFARTGNIPSKYDTLNLVN